MSDNNLIANKISFEKKWKYNSKTLKKINKSLKFEKENFIWFYRLIKKNWILLKRNKMKINWTNFKIKHKLFSKLYTIQNEINTKKWIFYNELILSNYKLNINWFNTIFVFIVKEYKQQIHNDLKLIKINFYFIDENTNEQIKVSFYF